MRNWLDWKRLLRRPGYSVLNLQKEYSQGNQIKTYLFERLKTEKITVSTRKKAERSDLADANQLRLIRLSCGFIFYKFYPLGIYKCTNNEFEFLKLQNILQIEKKKQTSRSIAKVISRKGVKKKSPNLQN